MRHHKPMPWQADDDCRARAGACPPDGNAADDGGGGCGEPVHRRCGYLRRHVFAGAVAGWAVRGGAVRRHGARKSGGAGIASGGGAAADVSGCRVRPRADAYGGQRHDAAGGAGRAVHDGGFVPAGLVDGQGVTGQARRGVQLPDAVGRLIAAGRRRAAAGDSGERRKRGEADAAASGGHADSALRRCGGCL